MTVEFKQLKRGDPIPAEYINELIRLAKRRVDGPGFFEDASGWHFAPSGSSGTAESTRQWAQITATVSYSSSASVYTATLEGSTITINRVCTDDTEAAVDMRTYAPWFAVGEWVPVIEWAGSYAIDVPLLLIGANKSLTWNATDGRLMAVWQ